MQKKNESGLKKENELNTILQKAIFENIETGIIILTSIRNKTGRITDFECLYINKKAEEITNKSGLTGKLLFTGPPESKYSDRFNHFIKVVENGISWEDEICFHDGENILWNSFKVSKLDDGCLVTFSDTTKLKNAGIKLKLQQELLHVTFEGSPDQIQVFKAVRNEQGTITDFIWKLQNNISREASGNLIGKCLLEVNLEAAKSGTFDRFIRVTETGLPEQAELANQHEQFDNYYYQYIVKLNDGVVTTIIDITEQKNKEQEVIQLKESLHKKAVDRYNSLFNSIDQGFCTIKIKFDKNNRPLDYLFMEVSPSFEYHTGIKNAVGKWMREIVANQDEFWFDKYGSVALTRKPERFEYFSTPLKRWWSVYAFPVDEPELYHIGVLFYDITARKKEEKEKDELFAKIAREKAVLTATLDSLPLAVWIADRNGKFIQSNEQIKIIWGEQGQNASNINDYQKFKGWWPDSGKQLKPEDWAMARALLKGETVIEEEVEIQRFNGEKAYILNNAAPVRDETGNIIGGIIVEQDITERKKINLKLRAAEARNAFLLKLSDALRFIDDPALIQYEAARVLGVHLGADRVGYAEDLGDNQTVTVTRNYINGVPDIKGTYNYEDYGPVLLQELKAGHTLIREDIANDPTLTEHEKEMHHILQLGATVNKPLLKNGRLKAILFIHFKNKHVWTKEELALLDETAERTWAAVERARAEDALRQSKEDYRQRLEKEVKVRTSELVESQHFVQLITDSTPDILFVYDITKWKIIYVNKGLSVVLGYKPEEVYASGRKEFEQMLHPDDLKRRIGEMARMVSLKPGEVRESEFRIKDKAGNLHWLNVRDLFFKADKKGKTIQALSICQDITEKIQAIDAYRHEKGRSEELRRMNELMDTFVFAAAHDLKAPVSNLKMLTQVIEKTEDADKKLMLQLKYADIIETLDLTISGLVKVLAVEKDFKSGLKTLHLQKVFSKVAAEMKDEIEKIKPEININFSCKSIVYIESYLFSIFRNLLGNALKFRSEERNVVIDVSSGCEEEYVWVSFTDNGIGIDLKKYGQDMYKPFKRFSTGLKGSGLGLHLVKSIVTKNGGKIEVKSKKSAGTTFKIYMVPYKY